MAYTLIQREIWDDKEFVELSTAGKLLYVYIITNSKCNQAGFYKLPKRQVAFDLGDEAVEELNKGNGLFEYDPEHEVVLIPTYLKYNYAKSLTQRKGINTSVKVLPKTPLILNFMLEYVKYVGQDLSIFDECIRNYCKMLLTSSTKEKHQILKSLL